MNDALYGMLLASVNEVSYAIAESVGKKMGGGFETFIQKMNAMIREEKRKAKKKRRWHILLVAAIILILNAGIVLAKPLYDGA